MYKLIFELITQPLGLPIHWIYEYIILLVVQKIAFQFAWYVSPGGKYGSEIHWGVRILTFLILWLVLYTAIFIVKWLIINWILVVSALAGIIVSSFSIALLIRWKRASNI